MARSLIGALCCLLLVLGCTDEAGKMLAANPPSGDQPAAQALRPLTVDEQALALTALTSTEVGGGPADLTQPAQLSFAQLRGISDPEVLAACVRGAAPDANGELVALNAAGSLLCLPFDDVQAFVASLLEDGDIVETRKASLLILITDTKNPEWLPLLVSWEFDSALLRGYRERAIERLEEVAK